VLRSRLIKMITPQELEPCFHSARTGRSGSVWRTTLTSCLPRPDAFQLEHLEPFCNNDTNVASRQPFGNTSIFRDQKPCPTMFNLIGPFCSNALISKRACERHPPIKSLSSILTPRIRRLAGPLVIEDEPNVSFQFSTIVRQVEPVGSLAV